MKNKEKTRSRRFTYFFSLVLALSSCTFSPESAPLSTKAYTQVSQDTPNSTTQVAKTQLPDEWLGAIPVENFENASPEAITEALMHEWLVFYVTESDDPQWQLSNYRIESIEIPKEWQTCATGYEADYIVEVVYSVQPILSPPQRWAATGTLAEDNWIIEKPATLAIRQTNALYQMLILGVPIC